MARTEGVVILKHKQAWIGLVVGIALLVPLALAQETHVSREGGGWGQEITGTLAAVKNLHVKVDMGAVVVRGGQQQGINYVVHTRLRTSSEQEARHQFEQYKVTAYVKGDTAWIVGDWQGGQPRHCSEELSVMVPREIAMVKLETDGGSVDTSGVSGRVEAETGGGGIRFDDIGGGANAETGGGSIEVGTAVTRVGASSFAMGQAAFQDGECVALADCVMVKAAEGRPVRLTGAERELLARLAFAGAGVADAGTS